MKKLTIFLLIGLFLVVGVSAYTIGQVISQAQLDNQNISSTGFNIQLNNLYKEDEFVIANFNYTTLIKNETEYIVVNRMKEIRCKKTGTREQVENCLKTKVRMFKQMERRKLESWQTEGFDIGDIELGDLNA